jgi:hypothetical protein
MVRAKQEVVLGDLDRVVDQTNADHLTDVAVAHAIVGSREADGARRVDLA